jgi:hypothetical protein
MAVPVGFLYFNFSLFLFQGSYDVTISVTILDCTEVTGHITTKIDCWYLLFITTCYGSLGHLQVNNKIHKLLGRLTAT